MISKKNNFLLYTDYKDVIKELPLNERGLLFTAILDYAYDRTLTELPKGSAVNMCFSFIRNHIDRDTTKYNERCERNRENGRKGGKATASNRQRTRAKQADNDNDNDIDIESESESDALRIKDTRAHGKFSNVFLSNAEFEAFSNEYENANEIIERLSNYKQRKGKNEDIEADYAWLESFARTDGIKKARKKTKYEQYLTEAKLGYPPPDNAGLTEEEIEKLNEIAEENM